MFDNWPFPVHYWEGGRLIITNTAQRNGSRPGQLWHWQLVLHGTAMDTTNTREAAPGTAAGENTILHQKIFFLHQTGHDGLSRFCTKIS